MMQTLDSGVVDVLLALVLVGVMEMEVFVVLALILVVEAVEVHEVTKAVTVEVAVVHLSLVASRGKYP